MAVTACGAGRCWRTTAICLASLCGRYQQPGLPSPLVVIGAPIRACIIIWPAKPVQNRGQIVIRRLLPIAVLLVLGAAPACSSSSVAPSTTSSAPFSQTDLVVGTGTPAGAGNRATVAYTGWLYDSSKADGKGTQFDSGASFTFTLGAGSVIKGWDQGVVGMMVGGKRRLVIPPELAYGSSSPGAGIPPNATLVFDITLASVQ